MKHKNLPRKARKLSSLDRYPSDAKTIFNKLCRTKPPQLGICTAPSHKKSKLKCETPCCKSTNFVPALRAEHLPEAQKQYQHQNQCGGHQTTKLEDNTHCLDFPTC